MDTNEIFERLNEVFRDVFDDDTITVTEDTTAVEDEFDIKFNMKDVVSMKRVGDMVDIIQQEA